MPQKKTKILTLAYLLFLVLLLSSGSLDGVLSEIIYYLAFILPVLFALLLLWRSDDKGFGIVLRVDSDTVLYTLLFLAPTVILISSLSALTSLLVGSLTGVTNGVSLEGSLPIVIIEHALLPAILEELLFRYLPYRCMKNSPPLTVVFTSALVFSVAHMNLFSIPYALFAGAILMSLVYMTESLLPSLIIHFINNLCSIMILLYGDTEWAKISIFVIFGLLLCLSLLLFVIKRKSILPKIRDSLFAVKPYLPEAYILLFVIPAMLLAFLSFGGEG